MNTWLPFIFGTLCVCVLCCALPKRGKINFAMLIMFQLCFAHHFHLIPKQLLGAAAKARGNDRQREREKGGSKHYNKRASFHSSLLTRKSISKITIRQLWQSFLTKKGRKRHKLWKLRQSLLAVNAHKELFVYVQRNKTQKIKIFEELSHCVLAANSCRRIRVHLFFIVIRPRFFKLIKPRQYILYIN